MSLDRQKVIIVGNTRVGKTCLVDRFLGNDCDPNHRETVGAAYSSVKVKLESGDDVQLDIWDTAGQEEFKSISDKLCENNY